METCLAQLCIKIFYNDTNIAAEEYITQIPIKLSDMSVLNDMVTQFIVSLSLGEDVHNAIKASNHTLNGTQIELIQVYTPAIISKTASMTIPLWEDQESFV